MGDTVTIHPASKVTGEAARDRIVEVVVNGRPVARKTVPADDQIHDLKFVISIDQSSWVALRQFPQLHTNPVIVLVGDRPVRASRSSALWCAGVVEQLWRARAKNIAPAERDEAQRSFQQAIEIYRKIAFESPAGT